MSRPLEKPIGVSLSSEILPAGFSYALLISIWHGPCYDRYHRLGRPIFLCVEGQSRHRKLVVGNSHISMCVVRNAYVYLFFCCIYYLTVHPVSGIGTAVAVGVIPEFTEFIKFKVIVILWLAHYLLLFIAPSYLPQG